MTGTCARGISLANIKNAEIRGIKVNGYSGPLIGVHHVTGTGIEGAATLDPPRLPDPILPATHPYQLR